MNARIGLSVVMVIGLIMIITALPAAEHDSSQLDRLKQQYAIKPTSSVDHSQFGVLKGEFKRPQDVTAACISCHNQRHTEVMQSSHWDWEGVEYIKGRGLRPLGKRNVLNNFCIGIQGNEQTCNKCHIGYGYSNAKFDFKDPTNVDCLACHDNSNTYVKKTAGAGMPDPKVDLSMVAQHVGKPLRSNCGTCHFYGGGGNNVKHGDLEMALFNPTKEIDVHMGVEGSDMQCVACHTADKHQMLGKMYSVSSMNRHRVQCESCHGNLPHADDTINKHMLKVACQTCHIPTYAKVNPTKLRWDWSTAGKLKDGKPYEEKDASGTDVYMSIKGSFKWGSKLEPEYAWFNGTATHYLVGDKINPNGPTELNSLQGSYDDPNSKIIPVKVHRAKQVFDVENQYLIQPKTFSNKPGDGGYWKEFNWQRANEEGMKLVGLPYSGKYGFTDTVMYWPINHMVSDKTKTVACAECHTRKNGRLAKLSGFYIPGRDRNSFVDTFGRMMLILTTLGVGAHGLARIFSNRKGGK